jgi:hypothetical protein
LVEFAFNRDALPIIGLPLLLLAFPLRGFLFGELPGPSRRFSGIANAFVFQKCSVFPGAIERIAWTLSG